MSDEPMDEQALVEELGYVPCTATSKQSKLRCRRRPVPGLSVCVMHGGKTPAAQTKAAEVVQQEKAAAALSQLLWSQDAQPVTDAVAEMRGLAGKMRLAVDVLGSRLNERVVCPTCHRGPEPLDGTTGRAWLTAIREQRQLLMDMERLGLAEKQVELEADQAAKVITAWRDVMALKAVLALPPADRDAMLRTFLTGLGVQLEALEVGA